MPCHLTTLIAAVLTTFLFADISRAQERISFPTQDGGIVFGDLYGKGDRGIVLAHGGRFTKESWEKQARMLATAGFRALAIEFRGEGKSHGGIKEQPADEGRYLDVLAASHYLRRVGTKFVSVVGASMGGDYAAEAAQADPDEIDSLVLLASGAYTPLTKMKGRKLFILARDDANADGPRLPKIRAQYEKALDPKKLIILDGSAHAQFLFQTNQGDRVMREILQFIRATIDAAVPDPHCPSALIPPPRRLACRSATYAARGSSSYDLSHQLPLRRSSCLPRLSLPPWQLS